MGEALQNRDSFADNLLTKLNDPQFIEKFTKDPQTALQEVDMQMELSEFASLLSNDPKLYNSILNQISGQLDINQLLVACSSACN